jgi:hypothetical protein
LTDGPLGEALVAPIMLDPNREQSCTLVPDT